MTTTHTVQAGVYKGATIVSQTFATHLIVFIMLIGWGQQKIDIHMDISDPCGCTFLCSDEPLLHRWGQGAWYYPLR